MGRASYAVGLDAGSTWIRCPIGVVENCCLRLLGVGLAPSWGWAKGRIADQQAVIESLRAAIAEAERSAGVSVESAVVGMGGATIAGVNHRGVYEMGRPREIGERDLRYAVELASRVSLPADRMILQLFPQDFAVDGRAEYRKPTGTVGSRLESFVHIITASVQEHQVLVSAVNQAHLAVEETVYEPVAAAYAAVLPEERSEGVAVLDIGSHSADLVIYCGDTLLDSACLPVSGDHFTRDVSFGLCVTYEDAQRLKHECGCAILGLTSDNSLIEVPSPEGRPPREAPRRELNLILEARAEELFLYVRRELERVDMEQGLMDGIVLAGGAAELPGMCDMAERVLNCQARNGLPAGIIGWPAELDTPSWAAAAGLMMYSARLKCRTEDGPRSAGLLNRLLHAGIGT